MIELIRHGFVVMKMEGRSYSIALPVEIPRMWFYSVPLVAGIFRMPFWPFQVANFASAFVWAAVLLTIGDVTAKVIKWIWA